MLRVRDVDGCAVVRYGLIARDSPAAPGHGAPVGKGVREPGHEDGRQDGGVDTLVVVGIDADFLVFGVEGKLADVQGLELVVRLEVGPAPDAAVDHVGKTFAVRNLDRKKNE